MNGQVGRCARCGMARETHSHIAHYFVAPHGGRGAGCSWGAIAPPGAPHTERCPRACDLDPAHEGPCWCVDHTPRPAADVQTLQTAPRCVECGRLDGNHLSTCSRIASASAPLPDVNVLARRFLDSVNYVLNADEAEGRLALLLSTERRRSASDRPRDPVWGRLDEIAKKVEGIGERVLAQRPGSASLLQAVLDAADDARDWACDAASSRIERDTKFPWFPALMRALDAWDGQASPCASQERGGVEQGVAQSGSEGAADPPQDRAATPVEQRTFSPLVSGSSPDPLLDSTTGDSSGNDRVRAHAFIYERFDESGSDEDVRDLLKLLADVRRETFEACIKEIGPTLPDSIRRMRALLTKGPAT